MLLLVVSIVGKIAVGSQSIRDAEQAQTMAESMLVTFLDRQGFHAVIRSDGQPDFRFVSAVAGDCRLIVVFAAPQGWHRSVIRQMASAEDQVLFVFRAALYEDQPVWLTWTTHYWRSLNVYFGRRIPVHPVFGIVASSACDLWGIPWNGLVDLPPSGL